MALEAEKKFVLGSLQGPQLLAGYLAGMGAVFIGERVIGGEGLTRYVVSGIGLVAVLGACLGWAMAWFTSKAARRTVEGLAALLAFGGLVGLGIYLLGSELVLGPAPVTRNPDAGPGLRQLLAVAWPIVLTITVLPLIFVQWSCASMLGGQGIEVGRVRASARAGAMTGMLLGTLFLVNAIANRKDVHTDLSYFKTTSPSESTQELVRGLDTDTQVLLFFPGVNEVLQEVRPYFSWLEDESDHLEVKLVDRALEPELAKKYRVSKDGTVVVVRGDARQTIDLGDKLDRAKRKLKKFDGEFQKAVMKLTRERTIAYMLTGHGERRPERVEGDTRSRVNVMKQYLISKNFTVKDLGAIEGLTSVVPDDAALLLWIDPGGPLFPGEADALKAYLETGGRMLITLDPDSRAASDELLGFLGLKYERTPLGHNRAFIPLSRTKADRYNLVTNNFSSHSSVSTSSRRRKQLLVLVPRSGSLTKVPGTKKKVSFVVRSLADTWQDKNDNRARDKEEPAKTHQLAAAVSMKVAHKKEAEKKEGKQEEKQDPKKDPKKDAKKGAKRDKPKPKKPAQAPEQDEMRVVVVADTDLFADDYIGFRFGAGGLPGNYHLLSDVINWLAGEGKVGGVTASEEDIKIAHTQEGETIYFYATIFAVPLIILGLGVWTGWGRGRKRRAGR